MIKEVNTAEFRELMPGALTLADFYSPNCGPCKMLSYVLADLDRTCDGIQILKINFDTNPELLEQYGVTGYPTIILFRDGQEVDRKAGLQQKPVLIKMIQAYQQGG